MTTMNANGRPNIQFPVAPAQDMCALRWLDGKLVLYIGWLFTGDKHPSEIVVNGGSVTLIPKRDIAPHQIGTLIWAFHLYAHRDRGVWKYHDSKLGRTGWFGAVYITVDIDGAIEQILAESERQLIDGNRSV
jgi:hypothetical protein